MKNLGPDVFPANAKEICPLDLQCKEMFTSPEESSSIFHLSNFLQLAKTEMLEYADEFKSPLLLDNRVLDVPNVLPWEPLTDALGVGKIYSQLVILSNVPVALLQGTVASSALTLQEMFILSTVTPFLKQIRNGNLCSYCPARQ